VDEKVIAAARLTGIHEMILKLPEGYQTRLGDPENPPMLSGGQMQRLGLARAIYDLPKLVVLDEPNANLDMAGDAALGDVITRLRDAGSTVIVMAHRPSVLNAVNKLMILKAGKVAVMGDRDTLLAQEPQLQGAAAGPAPALAARKAPVAQQTPDAQPALASQPLPQVQRSKGAVSPAASGRVPLNPAASGRQNTPSSASGPQDPPKARAPGIVRMVGPTSRRRQA